MDIRVMTAQFLGKAFKRCCQMSGLKTASNINKTARGEPVEPFERNKVHFAILLGMAIFTSSINAASDQAPTGLRNCGNTCFVNATLQCLFKMNLLNASPQCIQNQAPIVQEYLRLIGNHANIENFIASVRTTIGMARGQQQDAHEFLMRFLDILDPRAAFVRLQGTETMTCRACHTTNANAGRPFTLELDIDQAGSCFDRYFMQGEAVSANAGNGWRCLQCQRPVDATKKYALQTLPDYLTIQLKRFRQQRVGVYQRLDAAVSYPEKFSFDQRYFVPQAHVPHAYELFGVVMQSGSLSGGHYTAYVKHNNTWILCSDNVQIVPRPLPQNSSEPYILFYRKTTDLTGALVQGPMVTAEHHGTRRNRTGNGAATEGDSDEEGGEPDAQRRRTENQNNATQPQPNQPNQGPFPTLTRYNVQDYLRAKNGVKDLKNAQLEGAIFIEGDLSGVDFTGAMLIGALFQDTDLSNAKFCGAILAGATIINGIQNHVTFSDKTNCRGIFLKGVHFFDESTIKDTDFSHSQFTDVCFERSSIENTNMSFLGAEGLWFLATTLKNINFTCADIKKLCIEQSNIIGDGLNFSYATIAKGRIRGQLLVVVPVTQAAKGTAGAATIAAATANSTAIPTSTGLASCSAAAAETATTTGTATGAATGLTLSSLAAPAAVVVVVCAVSYAGYRYYCYIYPEPQSMLLNSNFCGARLEEVCFSNVKFDHCQNIETLRDATGILFKNVTSSIPADINVFKNNGAMVDGNNKKMFAFYWTGAKQKQTMEQYEAQAQATISGQQNISARQNHAQRNVSQELIDIEKALCNGEKNMVGKNLSGALIQAVDLTNVDFSHANLSNATFEHVILTSTTLKKTNLQGAHFHNVVFKGGTISDETTFQDVEFTSVIFDGTTIDHTSFHGATFTNVDFVRSHLTSKIAMDSVKTAQLFFIGCDLQDISFKSAKLTNLMIRDAACIGKKLDFSSAELNHCCFLSKQESEKSTLLEINFLGTEIKNSFFYGINFDKCTLQTISGKEFTTIFENITSSQPDDLEFLRKIGAKVNGDPGKYYKEDRWINREPSFLLSLVDSFRHPVVMTSCTLIGTSIGGPIGTVVGSGVGAVIDQGINHIMPKQ